MTCISVLVILHLEWQNEYHKQLRWIYQKGDSPLLHQEIAKVIFYCKKNNGEMHSTENLIPSKLNRIYLDFRKMKLFPKPFLSLEWRKPKLGLFFGKWSKH